MIKTRFFQGAQEAIESRASPFFFLYETIGASWKPAIFRGTVLDDDPFSRTEQTIRFRSTPVIYSAERWWITTRSKIKSKAESGRPVSAESA